MTEPDLQRIERELGIVLPAVYRQTMLAFPYPAFAGNDETELWDNADGLIELNRELRRGEGLLEPWPDRYYGIGRDQGGDCYALDLQDREASVRWADRGHLNPAEEAITPPFADWVRTCLEDLEVYLVEHGVDPRTGTPEQLRQAEATHARTGCHIVLIVGGVIVGGVVALWALVQWLSR